MPRPLVQKAAHIVVSELRKKLEVLYSWAIPHLRHSGVDVVSGDQWLAQTIGIRANTLSTYVTGRDLEYREGRLVNAGILPGALPAKHVQAICEQVFGIPQDLFVKYAKDDTEVDDIFPLADRDMYTTLPYK